MSSAQANPSMAVTAEIDYWSLKPRIKDIQWSNDQNAHLAHLYDEETGLKGAMKVCIDCVSMHIYVGCDGKIMSHGFENCDTNKPVYHPWVLAQKIWILC
jgi:peptide methionine sulfoxide reductase MsrB